MELVRDAARLLAEVICGHPRPKKIVGWTQRWTGRPSRIGSPSAVSALNAVPLVAENREPSLGQPLPIPQFLVMAAG
jgi:hypothetical protein